MTYLDVAKKDVKLKQEALYARAYVQLNVTTNGSWYGYDFKGYQQLLKQAPALDKVYNELLFYVNRNPKQLAEYVTKCDVIKQLQKGGYVAYYK